MLDYHKRLTEDQALYEGNEDKKFMIIKLLQNIKIQRNIVEQSKEKIIKNMTMTAKEFCPSLTMKANEKGVSQREIRKAEWRRIESA